MSSVKTVLSVQSHVTHGYVGNKAATFPLQLHGFDVDAINTVSLSNHSGYPVIKGHRADFDEFCCILDGLRANGFLSTYQYVLTGYVNNVDIVASLAQTVREIKDLRQASGAAPCIFICDPVMGDDGRMYCKPEVVEAYRALIAHADVATPNYYEASLLSEVEVTDLASATKAADWFHARGTKTVIVKSFKDAEHPNHLRFLVSTADAAGGSPRRSTGLVPFHEGRYTGTGDVFAASLLAFIHDHPLEEAVGKAMGVLQDLILATRVVGGTGESSLNSRELRVTASPDKLLHPTTTIEVLSLSV